MLTSMFITLAASEGSKSGCEVSEGSVGDGFGAAAGAECDAGTATDVGIEFGTGAEAIVDADADIVGCAGVCDTGVSGCTGTTCDVSAAGCAGIDCDKGGIAAAGAGVGAGRG